MSSSSAAYLARNELTTPEWNALRALEETPFFASTATNGVLSVDDLSLLWQGRKAKLDAERLQPYSDILYEDMRAELMGMKRELSSALRQKISEATHPRDIKVEFKSFFSAYEPTWPRNAYEGSDSWNAMVEHWFESDAPPIKIMGQQFSLALARPASAYQCGVAIAG
jgi:hypothetical protein